MKYFSKKVKNEHGVFDSKTEYERYLYLKQLEEKGEISFLKQQVKFEIVPVLKKKVEKPLKTKIKIEEKVDERAKHYTADFTYVNSNGQFVISEVKSIGTQLARDYPLRRALIKQIIYKHNEDIGFDDWIFEEYIPQIKKKKRK